MPKKGPQESARYRYGFMMGNPYTVSTANKTLAPAMLLTAPSRESTMSRVHTDHISRRAMRNMLGQLSAAPV